MHNPYAMLLWFLVALVLWFNWRNLATIGLLVLARAALSMRLVKVTAALILVGIWVNGVDDGE